MGLRKFDHRNGRHNARPSLQFFLHTLLLYYGSPHALFFMTLVAAKLSMCDLSDTQTMLHVQYSVAVYYNHAQSNMFQTQKFIVILLHFNYFFPRLRRPLMQQIQFTLLHSKQITKVLLIIINSTLMSKDVPLKLQIHKYPESFFLHNSTSASM